MELKQLNRKMGSFAPQPPLSFPATKRGDGIMKRHAKAAKSELVGTEQSKWEASQRGIASMSKYDIKTHDKARQSWWRQRWPLLAAARAWGDLRVKVGKSGRLPPQGTASDFRIFDCNLV